MPHGHPSTINKKYESNLHKRRFSHITYLGQVAFGFINLGDILFRLGGDREAASIDVDVQGTLKSTNSDWNCTKRRFVILLAIIRSIYPAKLILVTLIYNNKGTYAPRRSFGKR